MLAEQYFNLKFFDGKHTYNTMNELQICIFPAWEIYADVTDTQQITCNKFIAIALKGIIKFLNHFVITTTNIKIFYMIEYFEYSIK